MNLVIEQRVMYMSDCVEVNLTVIEESVNTTYAPKEEGFLSQLATIYRCFFEMETSYADTVQAILNVCKAFNKTLYHLTFDYSNLKLRYLHEPEIKYVTIIQDFSTEAIMDELVRKGHQVDLVRMID